MVHWGSDRLRDALDTAAQLPSWHSSLSCRSREICLHLRPGWPQFSRMTQGDKVVSNVGGRLLDKLFVRLVVFVQVTVLESEFMSQAARGLLLHLIGDRVVELRIFLT